MCLFDTRSDLYIPGGCVKNPEDTALLELANTLVRKSPRTIYNILLNYEYIDGDGYTEAMLAERYLELNPDIKEKGKAALSEKPVRKSRKPKPVVVEIDEETGEVREVQSKPSKPKGKPGRPKRIWTEAEIEAKTNAPKRGRGRPRKAVSETTTVVTGIKRGRGRPRKEPLVMTV